jgi:hypothetical protein
MLDYGSITAPARGAFAITPSDTTRFLAGGIRVGSAGNVTVECEDRSTVTITGVLAGEYIPLRVVRVLAATTAGAITGFRR